MVCGYWWRAVVGSCAGVLSTCPNGSSAGRACFWLTIELHTLATPADVLCRAPLGTANESECIPLPTAATCGGVGKPCCPCELLRRTVVGVQDLVHGRGGDSRVLPAGLCGARPMPRSPIPGIPWQTQPSPTKTWISQTKCRPSAPWAPFAGGRTTRASPTRLIAAGRASPAASSPLPPVRPLKLLLSYC